MVVIHAFDQFLNGNVPHPPKMAPCRKGFGQQLPALLAEAGAKREPHSGYVGACLEQFSLVACFGCSDRKLLDMMKHAPTCGLSLILSILQ